MDQRLNVIVGKRVCRVLAKLKGKELGNPWKKHGNIPL